MMTLLILPTIMDCVIPARAYKPRDKALVEGTVKLIYRSIYLRLEGRIFHDLISLNSAIRIALEVHNNTPFSGRSYSRRDQFEEIVRMTLGRLNPIGYELKKQTVVTVMKNGHIRLSEDAHYYSVPCKYIGKKVKLLYTSVLVEVYYRYEKIAEHERSYSRFRYTTDHNHLASHHRAYSKWSAEKFISEATAIHPDLGTYIAKVIESKAHPEQAYKSVQGILSFARHVGAPLSMPAVGLTVMGYIIIRHFNLYSCLFLKRPLSIGQHDYTILDIKKIKIGNIISSITRQILKVYNV